MNQSVSNAVIGLCIFLLVASFPLYARAECQVVVYGSAEYGNLINKGWGPIVMYNVAPPPGTTHRLCSDWQTTQSTTKIPPGTRPASEADLPAMRAAGIPDPKVGMPWNPDDPDVGQAAGDAKDWLRQRATKSSNISCLDSEFAQKLKKFMEAVPGGPPIIISAYRPPGAQVALVSSGASRAGPCESYHNYGLAADFSTNQIGWMRANSRQFGINIIGAWDPNHFQDARGIFGQCGACSGGVGGLLPDQGGGDAPFSPISNALRNFFNPPPPPPPPPPPIQQPLPRAEQQTLQSAFQFATPTSPSNLPTSVSSQINTNQNTNNSGSGTSTFDLIDQYANPVRGSIDIGTIVSIALNPNTSDIAMLQGTRPDSSVYTSGTITSIQPTNAPQTFTSGDLANSYAPPNVSAQNSFLLNILNTMKNTLLRALNYLKPFGGNVPSQMYAE